MIRYGVIEPVLLGFLALIYLEMQQFEALPLPAFGLEALNNSTPPARTARQVHGDVKTLIQNASGIFKVFPSKNRVELRPNGPVAPLGNTRSPRPRRPTAGIRFLAPPRNDEAEGSSGEGSNGRGSNGGGSNGGGSGGASGGGGNQHTNAHNEVTVTYKSYHTNARGDVITQQVRFQSGPFEKLDKKPAKNYFPSMKKLSTVCINKSTIYNEIKVEKWLMRGLNSKKKTSRPFLIKMRREIYDKGQSEICHNLTLTDWQKYQECAIRRNQRLEYLIPNYPNQQVVLN